MMKIEQQIKTAEEVIDVVEKLNFSYNQIKEMATKLLRQQVELKLLVIIMI